MSVTLTQEYIRLMQRKTAGTSPAARLRIVEGESLKVVATYAPEMAGGIGGIFS